MTPAAAAILEGMPDPSLLHRADRDGTTWILAGPVVLACYPSGDAGLRNVAVAVCRQLGFSGRAVAEVMGLTENYVATLHNRALREGTAGLVRAPGRPRKLAAGAWEQAARWRAGGASDSEIARRLQVAQSTVFRRLGPAAVQEQLPGGGPAGEAEPQAGGPEAGPAAPGPGGPAAPGPQASGPAAPEPGPGPGPEPSSRPAAGPGPAAGTEAAPSRYAGAMLAHAYLDRIGAEAILAAALPPGLARPRYDDLALLAATSLAFAPGVSSAEGTKHLIPGQAGILAGIGRLPGLRTLRPRLSAIAGTCDPLALQRQLGAAMLAADAPGLHVYYVDDHFVPYEGAKPVPKGWNTKRRHAQPGRAGTVVTGYRGRAVCFADGEPSGLSATLPPALTQLRQVLGPDAQILLGFDRGGSYPQVFRAIRGQHAGWVTWRRAPLAPAAAAPRRFWAARGDGKPAEVVWLADETVTIKDYGQARQITLFEHGAPVLQVLTSDTAAPAAALLAWLRCRWREENLFKYLEAHYGIHWLTDYHASLQDDTHLIGNPERKVGRARLRSAEQALAAAERELATLLTTPELSAAAKNTAIPAAENKITQARDAVTAAKAALKHIPAKLPASQVTPGAQKAILRTRRRSLQMVLRLLAAAAEHWLGNRLNDYLRDPGEYRAISRHLLHLGGTITRTPRTITVTLDPPAAPRIARALALLLDEINATPPRMPGDTRPITYRLATPASDLTTIKDRLPEV